MKNSLACGIILVMAILLLAMPTGAQPAPLPGTQFLPQGVDLDAKMLSGIDRFLDRATEAAPSH